MNKKRLLELAGITEGDWGGEMPVPPGMLQRMRNDEDDSRIQRAAEKIESVIAALRQGDLARRVGGANGEQLVLRLRSALQDLRPSPPTD